MSLRYFVLAYALIACHAFAIDEDFYIPYTDNYGYKYDPETGRFIKEDSTAVDSVVEKDAESKRVTSASHVSSQPTTDPPKDYTYIYFMSIGGGILVFAAVVGWSKQKKRHRLN